jgi:transposase
VQQQVVLALHTARSGFVKQRTALSNQIRGLLAEFGVVLPKGLAKLEQKLPVLLHNEPSAQSTLTPGIRTLMQMLLEQLHQLDGQIGKLELQIRQHARAEESCQRLMQIPGVGPITASALAASVGDASQFESGRQMSAWMGLVPRQHSTGGKNVLLSITKRGDKYLRTLVIHGARAMLKAYQKCPQKMPAWVRQLLQHKHPNIVCVALASRNVRTAWAMLTRGEDYRARSTITDMALAAP